ncbi:glutathione S-transferase omega-1-like [Amphiura filiformis]|uniref:glutathione S-transferase omega-1-like n=1 Tax=Amphiura filiformis TaxID=82378 RepID=UPI003B215585
MPSNAPSSKHLVTGDELPPVRDKSILLFGMGYCPFAQRVQLTMLAKGVQFDTINCNLDQKPEFFTKRNPKQGCVPTIDRNGQVVWESEVICNLLEEWYPDVPLYPKDPYSKAKDQLVVSMFNNKVIPSFYKVLLLRGHENEDVVSQYVEEFTKNMTEYANELETRGTKFYAGNDKPGMVDYLCWPWVEKTIFVDRMKAVVDSIPVLKAYVDEMLQQNIVKDNLVKKDHYLGFAKSYAEGKRIYDF